MATISQWTPYGVALSITATAASVTRTSASQYTVKFNVSWKTYWDGAETNYGVRAGSGGGSVTLNEFGTYASSGSGTFTGTYSISGNAEANPTISVNFQNYEEDWEGNVVASKSKAVSLQVKVPAWTSYTITYNANGGTGAPGSQVKWKNQSITLQTTIPTLTGHTFKGWATSASGAVAYQPGDILPTTVNYNLTLYAVWEAYTYTVTYNENGGTGAPDSQTKTYGVSLTLSRTIPTKTNYTFLGWSTSASGTVVYNAGATYTANANIKLYAVWSLDYSKPRITNLSIQRCTSNGTISESGTYAKVSFKWDTDKSVSYIRIGYSSTYKAVSASGTSGQVSNEIVGNGTLNAESTYKITVTVADSSGSSYATMTLSSKAYPLDVLPAGNGAAFGKAAEKENALESAWEIYDKFGTLVSNGIAIYTGNDSASAVDPNTTLDHIVLTNKNTPTEHLYYIFTAFRLKNQTNGRGQIAIPYSSSGNGIWFRHFDSTNSEWSDWNKPLFDGDTHKHIFTTTAGGFRFAPTWFGLYNTAQDAADNTNRNGWIGYDSGTTMKFTDLAGGGMNFKSPGTIRFYGGDSTAFIGILSDRMRTSTNDTYYLGAANYYWKAVYAVNGTIQTSDRNKKSNIKPIDQKYIELFDKLQPVTFEFSGKEHDRVHIGFIAQDVKEAMDELDISSEEFAAFCRDIKMETVEVVDENTGEISEKEVECLDENGNPIYLYSLRYTEFIALNTRMIQENRRKIEDQKTEIDALKRELDEIKALLKGDTNVTEN